MNVFEVTDWGLKVQGKDIGPGSKLMIKGAPHPSWNGVGKVLGQAPEKVFTVATPKEDDMRTFAVSHDSQEDITDLIAQYEEVIGKKPHHMMKPETMQQKIDEALNG